MLSVITHTKRIKVDKKIFGGNGYIDYLNCGVGFTGV